MKGMTALKLLDQTQVIHLKYEAFFDAPQYNMDRMIDFVRVERTPQWIYHVCQMVKMPQTSWQDLPIDHKEALEKACEPGMAMLENVDTITT